MQLPSPGQLIPNDGWHRDRPSVSLENPLGRSHFFRYGYMRIVPSGSNIYLGGGPMSIEIALAYSVGNYLEAMKCLSRGVHRGELTQGHEVFGAVQVPGPWFCGEPCGGEVAPCKDASVRIASFGTTPTRSSSSRSSPYHETTPLCGPGSSPQPTVLDFDFPVIGRAFLLIN
jgi:hypothetical protein